MAAIFQQLLDVLVTKKCQSSLWANHMQSFKILSNVSQVLKRAHLLHLKGGSTIVPVTIGNERGRLFHLSVPALENISKNSPNGEEDKYRQAKSSPRLLDGTKLPPVLVDVYLQRYSQSRRIHGSRPFHGLPGIILKIYNSHQWSQEMERSLKSVGPRLTALWIALLFIWSL